MSLRAVDRFFPSPLPLTHIFFCTGVIEDASCKARKRVTVLTKYCFINLSNYKSYNLSLVFHVIIFYLSRVLTTFGLENIGFRFNEVSVLAE